LKNRLISFNPLDIPILCGNDGRQNGGRQNGRHCLGPHDCRYKTSITTFLEIQNCRYVGDNATFFVRRYFSFPADICK
jgi:hypothetical protein